MGLSTNYDFLVIAIGALLGSAKANMEFSRSKSPGGRLLDLALGVFCGVSLALHFANDQSATLSGGLALLGGVSGGVVVDVFMQMIPSIARKAIKNIVDKNLK